MRQKTGKQIACTECGKNKYFSGWYIKRKEQKRHINYFCSQDCYAIYQTGRSGNRGKPAVNVNCSICSSPFKAWVSNIKVGKAKTCSKECAAKSASKTLLKKDKRCYGAQHLFIRKQTGGLSALRICVDCGVTSKEKKIEMSNVDHKYSDDPNDYISRCTSCHRKYDIQFNNYKSLTK